MADANGGVWRVVFAIFFWSVGAGSVETGVQFGFGRDKFPTGTVAAQMENGGKAFAVFVMAAVKSGTVYGLLHKITFQHKTYYMLQNITYNIADLQS